MHQETTAPLQSSLQWPPGDGWQTGQGEQQLCFHCRGSPALWDRGQPWGQRLGSRAVSLLSASQGPATPAAGGHHVPSAVVPPCKTWQCRPVPFTWRKGLCCTHPCPPVQSRVTSHLLVFQLPSAEVPRPQASLHVYLPTAPGIFLPNPLIVHEFLSLFL